MVKQFLKMWRNNSFQSCDVVFEHLHRVGEELLSKTTTTTAAAAAATTNTNSICILSH